MTTKSQPPLSLYIHLPWCVRKCPYCDFNSHQARESVPEERYIQALLTDLEQDLPKIWGRVVHTIFIGGGTPSLFSASAIEALLNGVRARLQVAPGAEITLEANPGTVEHDRFEGYRAAGVNRVSLGIQSFDDDMLKRLGRIHGRDEAITAIEHVRAAGFDNFNLDLMFALPDQNLEQAVADIETALEFAPPHLSHYQLTLEPNTEFALRPPPLPDDDAAWSMQRACRKRLTAAGYDSYEISAWSRPAHACHHNLNYWRFGDYLGIGAGAHGKLTFCNAKPVVEPNKVETACGRGLRPRQRRAGNLSGRATAPVKGFFAFGKTALDFPPALEAPPTIQIERTAKHRHPKRYLDALESGDFIAHRQAVNEQDRIFEYFLNRFRLSEPVPLAEFEACTGLTRGRLEERLARAAELGLIDCRDDSLVRTEHGERCLNDLQMLFLP